jgi:hypothetical protein
MFVTSDSLHGLLDDFATEGMRTTLNKRSPEVGPSQLSLELARTIVTNVWIDEKIGRFGNNSFYII